jgi:hypothetical protein
MFGRQRVTMTAQTAVPGIAARTSRKMPMKPIEYEFTLPDGSKRYEFVDPGSGYSVMTQIRMFKEMHGAIAAKPVSNNDSPAD